jgi:hypothetical protein
MTLARWLKALAGNVIARGSTRRTRYALRRELRGSSAPLPLYRVDEAGHGHAVGELDLVYPEGSALNLKEALRWPLDDESRDGWFDGLPYPLMDMRPQGFLGRNFAHRHALGLAVSSNPEEWSESDVAYVLATMGDDLPGDLILGESAYRRFLDSKGAAELSTLTSTEVAASYPKMAEEALAQGFAGSSTGGEFPKFIVRRHLNDRIVDVIVKFSGADASSAVQRWADLLVCEHLALSTIQGQLRIAAAESAILRHAGRTFLEVVRFDRHGEFGRSPVCTLSSINAAIVGSGAAPWTRCAQALQTRGWLSSEDTQRVAQIWWFGRLIANTDMHEGNLAFRPGLALAPVYDMLPMLYAPLRGGELPNRAFVPGLPMPEEVATWRQAADAASDFWNACAADTRISEAFRRIGAENARALDRARSSVG